MHERRSAKVRRILQLQGRAATLQAKYESTMARIAPARHQAEQLRQQALALKLRLTPDELLPAPARAALRVSRPMATAHRARLPPRPGRAHDHARRRRRARPLARARAGPREHRALRAQPARARARHPHRASGPTDAEPPRACRRTARSTAGAACWAWSACPGAISLYLVWWVTAWVGAKLDRIIQLLEQIARALRVGL